MKEKIKLLAEILFLIYAVMVMYSAYSILNEKPEPVSPIKDWNPYGYYV